MNTDDISVYMAHNNSEMLSRSVITRLREQFCNFLSIEFAPHGDFFTFRLGFFFEIGKGKDILDWEWGLISDPGDREKRPCP